jgi:hypothetical protein
VITDALREQPKIMRWPLARALTLPDANRAGHCDKPGGRPFTHATPRQTATAFAEGLLSTLERWICWSLSTWPKMPTNTCWRSPTGGHSNRHHITAKLIALLAELVRVDTAWVAG